MKPALICLLLLNSALAQTNETVAQTSSSVTSNNKLPKTGSNEIYEGLVFGVGAGTLAVIIVALLSILMCLFKDVLATPNLCVGAAIILPLIVLAIVRGLPVKSLETDAVKKDELPTSNYFVRTTAICSLIFISAALLCLAVCCSNFTT